MLAFFSADSVQPNLTAAGGVAATAAATAALAVWIRRPDIRPGWHLSDIGLVLLLVSAAVSVYRARIRFAAELELHHLLECAGLFITATYLTARRPQPLFLLTIFLLGAAAAAPGFLSKRGFSLPDAALPPFPWTTLAAVCALTTLAVAPWLAGPWLRRACRWYHWLVLAAALGLAGFAATGGIWTRDRVLSRAAAQVPPHQSRQVIGELLKESWAWGCGPAGYAWIFRARMPAEFHEEIAELPPALLWLVEYGALGSAAFLFFILAALGPIRAGPWAKDFFAVIALARPLRWTAACVFCLWTLTPAMRTPFGQVILWSLLGMLRGWSSDRPVAPAALVAGKEPPTVFAAGAGKAAPVPGLRQFLLTFGVLLLGIGLTVVHLRPVIAAHYRALPKTLRPSDVAWLERLELAAVWWPADPQTYQLQAMHYRAKADAGYVLPNAEIEAITRAYEHRIRANPYDPLSHSTLALWHVARGDLDKAVEVTRRGIAYCPGVFELQYTLGAWLRRQNRLPQARDAFEQARLLRPLALPVLCNLIEIEAEMGNFPQARQWLRQALQIAPHDATLQRLGQRLEPAAKKEE
ncbi:MAG: hypothetical protein N3D11_03380 [Candidatus Sumerlaeia bacterium]|nr:hypothetical protein [Candidatus Sumerlaeia bacterium]